MGAAVLLAVDDRSDNLFVLKQVVETYLPEIKMLAAESAEAGLALAVTETIDGALIDVQMPGMNGIEMCRRLKADPRTALIHVILVTAHRATPELKAQGLEAGADDFIAKPIDNVELAAKLGVMLRLRAAEEALRRERDHLEEAVRERTQELRDAEYRYRTLFHAASDPIFISDLEGRLLEVNEEASRLLGYTRDELLRLTVSDLITPEYAAKRPALLKQLQATDHLLFETELVTRDRRIIPAETSSRMMDLQGRPTVLSIARDITERHQAEEALKESLAGLSRADLDWQPKPDCNSMGWLAWPISRGQDIQIASLMSAEQLWITEGWCNRFSCPPDPGYSGFGQTDKEVAAFRSPDARTLLGYHQAVMKRTVKWLKTLTTKDLARVLDEDYTPRPTVAVRIVSILADCHQHVGEIAYLHGLLKGKGWLGY